MVNGKSRKTIFMSMYLKVADYIKEMVLILYSSRCQSMVGSKAKL